MFIVYLFSAAIYRFKIVIDKSALSNSTTLHHHIVHLCQSVCLPALLPSGLYVCLYLPVLRLSVCLSVRPFSLSVWEKNIFAREEEDNQSKTGPSIVVRTSPTAINKDK